MFFLKIRIQRLHKGFCATNSHLLSCGTYIGLYVVLRAKHTNAKSRATSRYLSKHTSVTMCASAIGSAIIFKVVTFLSQVHVAPGFPLTCCVVQWSSRWSLWCVDNHAIFCVCRRVTRRVPNHASVRVGVLCLEKSYLGRY